MNSALVAGVGPTTFTGPSTEPFSSRNRIAPISSSSETHGMYCVPGPRRPPSGEPEEQLERPEQPTGRGEHQAGARMHDPRARVAGGLCGGFPVAYDVGEEPAARGCRLVERDPAAVAVVADGRLADQRGYPVLGDGAGEHVRGHVAAVADRLPARPAPRPVRDPDTVEVHHRIDAVERPGVEPTAHLKTTKLLI